MDFRMSVTKLTVPALLCRLECNSVRTADTVGIRRI